MKKATVLLHNFCWKTYELWIPDECNSDDFFDELVKDINLCENIESMGECVDEAEEVLECLFDCYEGSDPPLDCKVHVFDFFKILRLSPLLDSKNKNTRKALAELEKQANNNYGDELADEYVYMHKHLRGKLTVNQILDIIDTDD